MDQGAWQATVHGVTNSWTRLSDFTFHFHFFETIYLMGLLKDYMSKVIERIALKHVYYHMRADLQSRLDA